MAFRIIRQRKEARRNAKLEEIFEERDKSGSGYINYEQLEEIYRVYQLVKNLDQEQALRIFHSCNQSGTGLVSLEEFRAMVNKKDLINNQNSMEEPSSEEQDSILPMK